MFGSKQKIGFQVFIRQYLPLIKEMAVNEVDSLYAEINKNTLPILISKERAEFELFLLFLITSGYGLNQIKGYDDKYYNQYLSLIDEYLGTTFPHIELNPPTLVGKEKKFIFNDYRLYMRDKFEKYHELEIAFHKGKVSERDFPFVIGGIFFAHFRSWDEINEPLASAVSELYKKSLAYLRQWCSEFARNHQIVPDVK